MTPHRCVQVEAPAKINLGLEILGKRPDGFHEIRTVMTMLDLSDTIRVRLGAAGSGTDLPGLPAQDNLIACALSAFRGSAPGAPALAWSMVKRIPAAAGLGGASADAAAALVAANALAGQPLGPDEIHRIAASLGSDVPFFLGSTSALATGRGTELVPLSPFEEPVALLVPRVAIGDKTRTLYAMIESADFSDGTRSERVRTAIENRRLPDPDDLGNAFRRPLSMLVPDIFDLSQRVRELGVRHLALSGAGPTQYVIGHEACEALASSDLMSIWSGDIDVIWTRTRSSRLRVEPCTGG